MGARPKLRAVVIYCSNIILRNIADQCLRIVSLCDSDEHLDSYDRASSAALQA